MSFDAMMDELRHEYVRELPSRISDIEVHFAGNDVAVVREDFHKLKGTGKTYGIPEISILAAVIEEICLSRPKDVQAAVPVALTLLKEIHALRLTSQSFDIDQDQRFARLQALIS